MKFGMRTFTALAAAPVMAAMVAAPAFAIEWFDGKVHVDLNMLEGFQYLDTITDGDNPGNTALFDAGNLDPTTGFLRTRFNMSLTIHFNDFVTGFIDIAEEPNDFGQNGFSIEDDLSCIDLSVLDALKSPLAEHNSLIVRVGNPVPVLFQYRGFSDGAQTQGNPLIANSPFDMVTAETGSQILGHHDIGEDYLQAIDWDVVIGTPTFFEDFSDGRGYHYTGKVSFDVTAPDSQVGAISFGGGYSYLDSSDQLTPGLGGTGPQARPSGATEMVFGDGENIDFPGKGVLAGAGQRDTHSGLLPGIEMNIWQINAMYQPSFTPVPVKVIGFFAGARDEFSFVDANGVQTVRSNATNATTLVDDSVQAKESAVGGEFKVDVVPGSYYLAGRFTQVSNESDGLVTGDLTRYQIAAGAWLSDNVLFKTEYIYQGEETGSPGQIGEDWQGILFEFSGAL